MLILSNWVKMVETMPFGTDARRQMFRKLLEDMEKAEAENATVAILASMFSKGMVEINNHPEGGSDYLKIVDRPNTIDPRLSDFSIKVGEDEVNADELYRLHKADQNDYKVIAGSPYTPSYFKDENGHIYVAGMDVVSRTFQVERLDLDAWRKVLAETPKRPDENGFAYEARLDEKLQDVSGYNIIFQNMTDRRLRAKFGSGMTSFPSEDFENSVPTFAEFKARVGDAVAETGVEASVKNQFDEAVGSEAEDRQPEDRAPSLDEYTETSNDHDKSGLNHDGSSSPAIQTGNTGR